MEICVQGIHEQGTRVHELLLGPLQPGYGSVHRVNEGTPWAFTTWLWVSAPSQ